MLAKYGSPRLRRDVDRHGGALLALGWDGVLARLSGKRERPRSDVASVAGTLELLARELGRCCSALADRLDEGGIIDLIGDLGLLCRRMSPRRAR